MQINSVNNISFAGRNPEKAALKAEKRALKQAQKDAHSTYISQMQTNESLKMSVGRELENGKYKKASAKALLFGIVGTIASIALTKGAANKSLALDAAGKLTDKAASILATGIKAGVALSNVAAASLVSSVIISSVNEAKANKTAHDRGFLNDGDYKKFTSKEEAYAVTDAIYKMHTNA